MLAFQAAHGGMRPRGGEAPCADLHHHTPATKPPGPGRLACTSAGPYIAHEPADKLLMYIAYQPARILHISRPVYCTSAGPYTAYQPARILHINRPAYCISAGPYIAYQPARIFNEPARILHICWPAYCISAGPYTAYQPARILHISRPV